MFDASKRAVLALALVVGCASRGSNDVGGSDDAIVNGEKTSAYPSVVALWGQKPGALAGVLCTATVVSPTVVLTAAHCVDPAEAGEGNEYKIILAPNALDGEQPSIPVKEVHWDRQFNDKDVRGGHDIAVAILAKPTTLAPIPIQRTKPSGITTARLVGYGRTNGIDPNSAGIKRTAEVPITSVDDKFVVTGGDDAGTTACNGDSGGPVLADIDGVDTIIGVNSFGLLYCLGTGSSTRVDAYLDFIDSFLPAPRDAGPAPADAGAADARPDADSTPTRAPAPDASPASPATPDAALDSEADSNADSNSDSASASAFPRKPKRSAEAAPPTKIAAASCALSAAPATGSLGPLLVASLGLAFLSRRVRRRPAA